MLRLLEVLIKLPKIGFHPTVFRLKEEWNDFLYKIGILRKLVITKGLINNVDNFCVFASYQPSGINNLTIYYIKYLCNVMGFGIVFVSNCPLSDEDKNKLKPYCYEIIERANVGRDFGSYKCGILRHKELIKKSKLFLIANDSVYGPIQDLTRFTHKMKEECLDVISDTINPENGQEKHACSYFILMNQNVTQSNRFWEYWHNLKIRSCRKFVIKKGEKGFTIQVLCYFRIGCMVDYTQIINTTSQLSKQELVASVFSYRMQNFAIEYLFLSQKSIPSYVAIRPVNYFPFLALRSKVSFIKKDWVKKFTYSEFLIPRIKEEKFTTDINKIELCATISKDSFMSKKTLKLIKYGCL